MQLSPHAVCCKHTASAVRMFRASVHADSVTPLFSNLLKLNGAHRLQAALLALPLNAVVPF